ncbi:MAG: glycosyltransferase family 2 protein [Bacteroidales bacterium]|nr:glycosyltransferase family 2 protein [Bacteroidales bacterium]
MDLTVVICMYNAEKYIEETLESLMAQTVQDFQLLIINDCSTDNSVDIVKKFFNEHPRQYELVNLEKNQGIAYARNFALNKSTTKYLVFIDSDDIPLPNLLQEEYELLSNDSSLIAVSSWCDFIDENNKKLKGGTFLGDTTKEDFKQRASKNKLIFLLIQTMFDREYAKKAGGVRCEGFPEGKPRYRDYCEDLDLWTRMSDFYKEGKYIITIPKVLYHYRKIDGLSSNHYNMILKMKFVKFNLLRRRNDLAELSFVDFLNQTSEKQKREWIRESKAADNLRNGVYYIVKKHNLFKGIQCLFLTIWYNPSYIYEKIKHNLKLSK